jgi:hypothetical protein
MTVQITSIVVPWTTKAEFLSISFFSKLNQFNVRYKITITKNRTNEIKNIKSWCKLIIPSITGVALSWKNICQLVDESKRFKFSKVLKRNKIIE